ncbi:hypothetical protein [Canibacter oris]|uniref:Intracellular proteinase inhibitor BsuPI domain-containing protein n=1 Tax=Canibacter oris TaxID=1365628 RepID=A0A840DRM8_9MICO|nr:hypothetical protein [Canibacter oris]MBB4071806.1 hypothetical protein [Canibacter oris]
MDQATPKTSKQVRQRRAFVAIGAVLLLAGLLLIWVSSQRSSGPLDGEEVRLPDTAFDPNSSRNAELNNQAECGAGELQVVAHTDKDSYAAGELPQLSLSIENTGEKPCVKNLGTSQMVFEVQAGAETVWLSTDCQLEADDRLVQLQPGQKLKTAPLQWDRTKSAADTCDLQEREPVAGEGAAYHLLVAVGGVPAQDSKQFLLH